LLIRSPKHAESPRRGRVALGIVRGREEDASRRRLVQARHLGRVYGFSAEGFAVRGASTRRKATGSRTLKSRTHRASELLAIEVSLSARGSAPGAQEDEVVRRREGRSTQGECSATAQRGPAVYR